MIIIVCYLRFLCVFYFYKGENTAVLALSLDLRADEHVWVQGPSSLFTVVSVSVPLAQAWQTWRRWAACPLAPQTLHKR